MRFTLSAVAASALLVACVTPTEKTDPIPETEVETSVAVETEAMSEALAEDPYLWMEEVEGEAALAWVNAQNERSLAAIESYGVYQDNYAKALELATSSDRIPYGTVRSGMVYNFWQDETNVRGPVASGITRELQDGHSGVGDGPRLRSIGGR